MAANGFTYDPTQIIVTFGGIPLSGFGEGTMIDAKPSGDRYTRHVSADGEVTRVRSADRTHEITMNFQQSSPSNDYLSSVHKTDSEFNNGVLPLQIKDLSGTTLQFWTAAWIKSIPNNINAKDLSDRVWVIDTGQISPSENYGGNSGF